MAKLTQSNYSVGPYLGGTSKGFGSSSNSFIYNPYTGETNSWTGGSSDANWNLINQYRSAVLDKAAYDYQFNTQNEYNLPQNQMARLQAAGLNPHLVYGSGADTQSASPGLGNYNVSNDTPLASMRMELGNNMVNQLTNIMEFAQRGEMNNANINQMSANAAYIQGKTNLLSDQHQLNQALLRGHNLNNDFLSDTYDLRKDNLELDNDLKGVQLDQASFNYMASGVNTIYAWQAAEDTHTLNDDLHDLNELDKIIRGWSAHLIEQGIDPRLDPYVVTFHSQIMNLINMATERLGSTFDELKKQFEKKFGKNNHGIFSKFW